MRRKGKVGSSADNTRVQVICVEDCEEKRRGGEREREEGEKESEEEREGHLMEEESSKLFESTFGEIL